MKKKIAYVFLFGIIFGISGFFFVQNYIEKQHKQELEELNLISSLEDFVSRIKFYNGEQLTMSEADMVYYNYVDSKVSSVFMFSARSFYAMNKNDQKTLNNMINNISKSKKLYGITFLNKKIDPKMKIHRALHRWDGYSDNSFLKIKLSLEEKLKKSRISKDELETLRYVYTLEGEYAEANKINEKICKKSSKKCGQIEDVLVTGIVTDPSGAPIDRVTIMALNYPTQKNAHTGKNGRFKLKLKVNSLDKIRLRAVKRGLSDGFKDFYVYHPDGVVFEHDVIQSEANFVLNRAHSILTLDLDTNRVTFKQKGIIKSANFKDNNFHIRTTNNTYHIPKNGFFSDMKGTPYRRGGKIEVDLYEFDRSTQYDMNDLINLDISSENGNRMFIGGFLLSFGMPYFQFFAENGQEVFLSNKNPMRLTYQIVEIEKMKTKTNPVSEEDLEKMVQYSKDLKGYPLTQEFLIEKNLYNMPPWWILNRKKGIWENVPFRLINTDGLLESVFYSYRL